MSRPSRAESLRRVLQDIMYYKSGVAGLLLITLLVALSIYTVIALPVDRAIYLWRSSEIWLDNPRTAAPEWVQFFVGRELPKTVVLDSRAARLGVAKSSTPIFGTNMKKILIEFSFEYSYDDFPSEVNVFLNAKAAKQLPVLKVIWVKPSGDAITLIETMMSGPNMSLYVTASEHVLRNMVGYVTAKFGFLPSDRCTQLRLLFGQYTPDALRTGDMVIEKGRYRLIIDATVFDEQDDLDAKLVVYGLVHGIAGTDHLRRPLEIALLWGAPVALAFGLTASLVTSLVQMIIATIGAYYGGLLDSLIQRITEIYMVLPFLPFLIMISVFYQVNIWVILVVVIVLSIFGGGIKSTRALVMQIKEYPYIEAARTYGASNMRIIFLYIIPKILPPIVPGLISAVPGFVFLEAALAFLGLGDPLLPTWGKVINDAFENGAVYKGYYYWVLEPSALLILTGIAFALFGFALDRIVNPRLREL
ncbi:MAG: ABC transporter permease [Thermofilum sp.]